MLPDSVTEQSGQSTKEEACLHHTLSFFVTLSWKTADGHGQAGLEASSPHRSIADHATEHKNALRVGNGIYNHHKQNCLSYRTRRAT